MLRTLYPLVIILTLFITVTTTSHETPAPSFSDQILPNSDSKIPTTSAIQVELIPTGKETPQEESDHPLKGVIENIRAKGKSRLKGVLTDLINGADDANLSKGDSHERVWHKSASDEFGHWVRRSRERDFKDFRSAGSREGPPPPFALPPKVPDPTFDHCQVSKCESFTHVIALELGWESLPNSNEFKELLDYVVWIMTKQIKRPQCKNNLYESSVAWMTSQRLGSQRVDADTIRCSSSDKSGACEERVENKMKYGGVVPKNADKFVESGQEVEYLVDKFLRAYGELFRHKSDKLHGNILTLITPSLMPDLLYDELYSAFYEQYGIHFNLVVVDHDEKKKEPYYTAVPSVGRDVRVVSKWDTKVLQEETKQWITPCPKGNNMKPPTQFEWQTQQTLSLRDHKQYSLDDIREMIDDGEIMKPPNALPSLEEIKAMDDKDKTLQEIRQYYAQYAKVEPQQFQFGAMPDFNEDEGLIGSSTAGGVKDHDARLKDKSPQMTESNFLHQRPKRWTTSSTNSWYTSSVWPTTNATTTTTSTTNTSSTTTTTATGRDGDSSTGSSTSGDTTTITYSNDMWSQYSGLILGITIPVTVLCLLCILGAGIFCIWKRREFKNMKQMSAKREEVHEKQIQEYSDLIKASNKYTEHKPRSGTGSSSIETDEWEVPRERLIMDLEDKLGSGAFSIVYKGVLSGEAPVLKVHRKSLVHNVNGLTDATVAIKVLPDYADFHARLDFVQEINFMKDLGYQKHLVSLIGCIVIEQPICLVTEYCKHGDLLHVVRKHKEDILNPTADSEFRFKDILSFVWQAADGMAYLASKGCIHRDVAARNILVDQFKTAKVGCDFMKSDQFQVGDFGLCRLLERTLYTSRGGRLPIKWMPIESLMQCEYTSKSDVWSFGVMLWESFTLGDMPYSWLQPVDMIDHLRNGNRLEKPNNATDELYAVMRQCWEESPDDRPDFQELGSKLARMLDNASVDYGYVFPENKYANHVPNGGIYGRGYNDDIMPPMVQNDETQKENDNSTNRQILQPESAGVINSAFESDVSVHRLQ